MCECYPMYNILNLEIEEYINYNINEKWLCLKIK